VRHHSGQGEAIRWTRALLATVSAALVFPAAAPAAGWSAAVRFPPGHDPKIGSKWTFNGTAKRGKTQLSGDYRYTLYFKGRSLADLGGQSKWRSFKDGHFSHALNFATKNSENGRGITEAIGLPLAIKVEVKTQYGTQTFSDDFTLERG